MELSNRICLLNHDIKALLNSIQLVLFAPRWIPLALLTILIIA